MEIADSLLALARWQVVGDLPPRELVDNVGERGIADVITANILGSDRYIGVVLLDGARQAGVENVRPISDVLSELSWATASVLDGSEAVGIPTGGVVVSAPAGDGRDRLGVLYPAVRSREVLDPTYRIRLDARWDRLPLPATVEQIRARRAAGTWPA